MYIYQRSEDLVLNTNKVKKSTEKEDFLTKSSFSRIEFEGILQALFAYSAPPSVSGSWSGTQSTESASNNVPSSHLTGLIDSHNLAEIGRSKNVNKTFIEKSGVKPINVYKGLFVDEKNYLIMIECCNPLCISKLPLTEAFSKYKSCHHCYTYYCSGPCRQSDWNNHKMKKCPLGRAVSAAKSVIKKILMDESCHNTFSNLGRGGYLRMGKGCIVVWFNNCNEAEIFSEVGVKDLKHYPVYICIKNINILRNQSATSSLSSVEEACSNYDPDKSIVINVSITLDHNFLRSCSAQMRHTKAHAIKRCLMIPLSKYFLNSLFFQQRNDSLRPTSLLLTMLPGQKSQDALSYNDRQVIFINILRQLQSRGIDLRHQYPYLYQNLTTFVEKNLAIRPTTIYPIDSATGRHFVCMIAPLSDYVSESNHYTDNPSNRSSMGSFMAELEAVIPYLENSEITDL